MAKTDIEYRTVTNSDCRSTRQQSRQLLQTINRLRYLQPPISAIADVSCVRSTQTACRRIHRTHRVAGNKISITSRVAAEELLLEARSTTLLLQSRPAARRSGRPTGRERTAGRVTSRRQIDESDSVSCFWRRSPGGDTMQQESKQTTQLAAAEAGIRPAKMQAPSAAAASLRCMH